MPQTVDQLRHLIAETPALAEPLAALRTLDLADAWIGAGLLRNAVWDVAHGRPIAPPNDVDVAHFDPTDPRPERDAELEAALARQAQGVPWEVRNQARMHLRHGDPPYADSLDAIGHWVETATAVAARLTPDGRIELAAPHGFDDLFDLIVRPVPAHAPDLTAFRERAARKRWTARWPRLQVVETAAPPTESG